MKLGNFTIKYNKTETNKNERIHLPKFIQHFSGILSESFKNKI